MTEPFCTITPSRGDRPELLNFCKHQISRMTHQPDETFFIDHQPPSRDVDLALRVRMGIAMAEAKGIDVCYIVEDDDYYPSDYFETMDMTGFDFIGAAKTIYYNVKSNTYQEFVHPQRSSLCFTGFRVSALKRFSWPPDDTVFLDLIMWRYAQKMRFKLLPETVGVGIKHGMGKTAGIGHRLTLKHSDADGSFLRSKVDSEAYAFYKTL